MIFAYIFCIGISCTAEPGDGELLDAAKQGSRLLTQFISEYEMAAKPADCTRLLGQFTERWKNEITPLQLKGLEKKGNVSEMLVNQQFEKKYPKVAEEFRDVFRKVHETGQKRAGFCSADTGYRKAQERAWRTFLGLREKN